MIGGRGDKPASKATVLFGGAMMTGIGALLSLAVLFGERAPGAPAWALAVAPIIALGGLACGLYLLVTGIRMRR